MNGVTPPRRRSMEIALDGLVVATLGLPLLLGVGRPSGPGPARGGRCTVRAAGWGAALVALAALALGLLVGRYGPLDRAFAGPDGWPAGLGVYVDALSVGDARPDRGAGVRHLPLLGPLPGRLGGAGAVPGLDAPHPRCGPLPAVQPKPGCLRAVLVRRQLGAAPAADLLPRPPGGGAGGVEEVRHQSPRGRLPPRRRGAWPARVRDAGVPRPRSAWRRGARRRPRRRPPWRSSSPRGP